MSATSVISIALPLLQSLRARPFRGAVASCFERACNLADDHGRVIALTLPAQGNGPFSIVVGAGTGRFGELEPGQPAYLDARRAVIGSWQISLASARAWDATLPAHVRLRLGANAAAILQPYARWPAPAADTPAAAAMARMLERGAHALSEALDGGNDLAGAARQLAGLGHGLTPAGDDYLVGAMAALWLLGDRDRAATIARSAAPHTTTLSGAFLMAAGQGHVVEPWHQLARSLARHSAEECDAAVRRIAEIGASSGRDALAGFATSMLNRMRSR